MKNVLSFNTKFGWISVTEMNSRITKIQFGRKKGNGKKSKKLENVKKNIISFFQKKTNKLNMKIFFHGNHIQKKVWGELKKVKKGRVKTYGEIAKKLKISPRYVGRICGENKHILFIPCHRIIRSNNTLGGFSAPEGIKLKRKLLEFEGVFI